MSAFRRELLVTAAAVMTRTVLPTATARAGQHPDAELIAACAAHDALLRQLLTTDFAAKPGSPAEDEALAMQERIAGAQLTEIGRMAALPATTAAGMAARAHSFALALPDVMRPHTDHDWPDKLVQAMVRDLLAAEAVR